MKKVILLALLGLSFNSFGQEFKKKDRIDSFFDARRKDRVDKVLGRKKSESVLYVGGASQKRLDSLARNNVYIRQSSSVLMHNYSNKLIAREVLSISGVIVGIFGYTVMNNATTTMSRVDKNSKGYISAENSYNTGKAFVYLGGASMVMSYSIHLSSLGTLRKYAIKRRKEELLNN
jgi:hypothetical protein